MSLTCVLMWRWQAATQFPLWDLARDLLDLSACVAQHMASVFEFCAQTPVILHRRCELEGEEASLSEIDASRWLDVFRRHRLLSIFYLGPQSGVLDLWTFQGGSPKHPMQATEGRLVVAAFCVRSCAHTAC